MTDRPVTIPADLVHDLWTLVKDARDRLAFAEVRMLELNRLLERMQQAGMTSWMPTIEDVRGAFRESTPPPRAPDEGAE